MLLLCPLVQLVLDVAGQDIHNARVLAAPGNDYVRLVDVVADILVIHGLHCGQVLHGNAVDLPAAILDVPADAAQQADIRLHVDIQLDEEKYSCDSVAVRVTIKKKSQSSESSSENDTPADDTPTDNTPDANTPGSDDSNNDAADDNSVDEQKNTDKDENEVSE